MKSPVCKLIFGSPALRYTPEDRELPLQSGLKSKAVCINFRFRHVQRIDLEVELRLERF